MARRKCFQPTYRQTIKRITLDGCLIPHGKHELVFTLDLISQGAEVWLYRWFTTSICSDCWCLYHSSCWIFWISSLVLTSETHEPWPILLRGPRVKPVMQGEPRTEHAMTLEHVHVRVIKPLVDSDSSNQTGVILKEVLLHAKGSTFLSMSQNKRTEELGYH